LNTDTGTQVVKQLDHAHEAANVPAGACAPGSTHPSVPDLQTCQDHYKKLYEKPDVSATIAFGYTDTRPDLEVDGGKEAHSTIDAMTLPCEIAGGGKPNMRSVGGKMIELKYFCGFTRDPDDATKFVKTVIGPDQKPHQFHITVVSAIPVGEEGDDQDLTTPGPDHDAQMLRTAAVTHTYLKALQTDDIVVYDGHARDGGGPDFGPPKLLPNRHPDYAWYRANRPGFNAELTALTTSDDPVHPPHHPAVIAMLACDTKLHFEKELKAASPESALLVTNMVTSEDVIEPAEMELLNGLIGQRCDDGFVESMESPDDIYEDQPKRGQAPAIDFEGWGVKTPNVLPAPPTNSSNRSH
jgi:hypothetical protein